MHIDTLLVEHAIIKTITSYMNAVDTGRWEDVAAYLCDDIFLDYTSIPGAAPAGSIPKLDAIARWREKFSKELAYQHHLSNLEVTIEAGKACCSGNNCGDHVLTDSSGRIVLWQIGVRLHWQLHLEEQGRWVVNSVKAEYLWDRTEPFNGLKLPSPSRA